MGMFDKDKEIGNQLDQAIELGQQFILLSVEVEAKPIKTDIGDATKTRLKVCKLAADGQTPLGVPFEVSTLASAIADKAKEASPEDFPCIVELRRVATKRGNPALVTQWISAYTHGDDIPF